LLIFLSACTSTHNFKTDGSSTFGGGFYDSEIKPGLYWMQADGNHSPFPSSFSALKTWKARAQELCRGEGYEELLVEESWVSPWGSLIARRQGYILCASSGISPADAHKIIQQQK
jgi:hypothetical protein